MTRPLLERIADLENLDRSWRELEANDAEDGIESSAVAAFRKSRFDELQRLHDELLTDRYHPDVFTEITLPKPDGGQRMLHISRLRDRIVERAFAQVVSPLLDPWFGPWSFAYRPGLGVHDAVARLVELRGVGCTHVVRADIRDCFPSIDRSTVLTRIGEVLADEPTTALIRQLLDRPVGRGSGHPLTGLPQGSPLSPLLANLFLTSLDEAMSDAGIPLIRYADDLVMPAWSEGEARRWCDRLQEEVTSLGLELGDGGGSMMSFTEGFAFLGEQFTTEWPTDVLLEPVVREPEKRVLFVSAQTGRLRTSKGQFVVDVEGSDGLEVPTGLVGRIVVFGAVALSAGARSAALDRNIDVVVLSRRGRFQGVITSSAGGSSALRRAQYEWSGDDRSRLAMAQRFVEGKVANQVALLQRYGVRSDEVTAARRQLVELRPHIGDCDDVPVLLGVEGAAARSYFAGFGALLPEPHRFTNRSRRPPLDPVNAALSFGYALLTGEATSALLAAGLDPAVGFLHGDDPGRPSLALDLMEEFRALVVDTVVLALFRRERLTSDHFRTESQRPGVLLTEEGRRRFLDAFESRMLTVFAHVPSGRRVSYRRGIHLQAVQLASVLSDRTDSYRPVVWR